MTDKKFTKDHEWILVDGEIGTVGITNHAQDSLGDIVFIELPKINIKMVLARPESRLSFATKVNFFCSSFILLLKI